MHLFESALAWEDAGGGPEWTALGDEIADLALSRFIAPESGALREFFDADWRALEGEGGLVEPGHQFEWAWLLARWGRARGEPKALDAARRLYANGLKGVDPARNVAVNALWEDFSVRDGGARLWPQTEHLKAALALGSEAEALRAAHGLAQYLDTPARGAWRDKLQPDGTFVEEPSPATSFYHLMVAILELNASI
jgi:mannose-6-phosphate isomerase